MADSKRLRTLKALTNWLAQEVSIANGYKHDLADSVFRGRLLFTDDDPIPAVAINEGLNPDRDARRTESDDDSRRSSLEKWSLQVQGWAKEDPRNPTDAAYELMADVKKALGKLASPRLAEEGAQINMGEGDSINAYCLGALVAGIEIEAGTVRPPEQTSEKAFFWMRCILKFHERVTDPYRYD